MTRAVSIGLALIVGVLMASAPTQAARFPTWARDALALHPEAQYPDVDAVVVEDEWRIKLKGGARSGTRRRLVHVLTSEGRSHASIELASGSLASYKKIRVWVRNAKGGVRRYSAEDGSLFSLAERRVFDDYTLLYIAPPGIGPGSSVALEVAFDRTADLPQDLFSLSGQIPVARSRIHVDLRGGWEVEATVSGTEATTRTDDQGSRVWEFSDIVSASGDLETWAPRPPGVILALNYFPKGASSPFVSWGSTAAWVLGWFGQPTTAAAAGSGPDGENQALIEQSGLAARELRYFSIALGMGGYVPRPPATTVARGFGDCKDKAQVMIESLAREGQEAFPVLIMAPSSGHVPDDLPSPFLFNHAVVAVPWNPEVMRPGLTVVDHPDLGPLRIYDATSSAASDRDTSVRLENAAALVLHPSVTQLVRLPRSSVDDSQLRRSHRWRVTESGAVLAEFSVSATGAMRLALESDDSEPLSGKELRDYTFSSLSGVAPGLEALTLQPIETRSNGAWEYQGEYRVLGLIAESGGLSSLDLGRFLGPNVLPTADESEPRTLYTRGVGGVEQVVEMSFREARYVGSVESFDVSNAVGGVRLTLESTDNGIRVLRQFNLTATEIPLEHLPMLAEMRDALRRLNDLILLFE